MKLSFITKVQMIFKMSNLQKRKKTKHFVHGLKTGKEIPTLKINITRALFDDLDLLIRSFFGGPGILETNMADQRGNKRHVTK